MALLALSRLTVFAGTLSPPFTSETPRYTLTLPADIAQVAFIPTAADCGASIPIGGVVVQSGIRSGAWGGREAISPADHRDRARWHDPYLYHHGQSPPSPNRSSL